VGAGDANGSEPALVEIAAPDDVTVDVLLHAGTTMPASTVAAAALPTVIIRVVIRGTPPAVVSSVP